MINIKLKNDKTLMGRVSLKNSNTAVIHHYFHKDEKYFMPPFAEIFKQIDILKKNNLNIDHQINVSIFDIFCSDYKFFKEFIINLNKKSL